MNLLVQSPTGMEVVSMDFLQYFPLGGGVGGQCELKGLVRCGKGRQGLENIPLRGAKFGLK